MNLHNLLRSSHLGLFYMPAASTGNTKNSSKNQCIDSVCKPLEGVWESSDSVSHSLFVSADLA